MAAFNFAAMDLLTALNASETRDIPRSLRLREISDILKENEMLRHYMPRSNQFDSWVLIYVCFCDQYRNIAHLYSDSGILTMQKCNKEAFKRTQTVTLEQIL